MDPPGTSSRLLVRLGNAFLRTATRRPQVEPNHAEQAGGRASREYHVLVTSTVRFVVWLGLWGILGSAVGLGLAWRHGLGAALAITSISEIIGLAVGLGLPFCWLWMTAPAVQRDEARATLDHGPEATSPVDQLAAEQYRNLRMAVISIQSELEDAKRELQEARANGEYRMPHDANNVFSTERWNGYSHQLATHSATIGAYKIADAAYREIRRLNRRVSPRFPAAREEAARTILVVEPGDENEIDAVLSKVGEAITALQEAEGNL